MYRGPETSLSASCFSIRASDDPGVLPRILAVFARRDVALSMVHAVIGTDDTGQPVQAIDLQAAPLPQDRLDIIADALRQIVDVERVLTAQKSIAAAVA